MTTSSVVCGASGQDGYYLVRRLLSEGATVYAVVRDRDTFPAGDLPPHGELHVLQADILQPKPMLERIASLKPDEIYNLAGQSSVSCSFDAPLQTWQSNADFVVALLDVIRCHSPRTRMYQASSTDMFGTTPGERLYSERSLFNPQSPYASAKAAAHFACRAWRESFDVHVACGILANHESHRRRRPFLTRKIADHARSLRGLGPDALRRCEPLVVGNLKVERDWGFAPDYVDGMIRILRQIDVRARCTGVRDDDVGANYRDYVLGTGHLTAVWELIDRAFSLAGHDLEWQIEGDDPREWRAVFAENGATAVVADPALFRPSDPMAIAADASLARRELGWEPRAGIDCFLCDMLEHTAGVDASAA